jgi:AcrR family transcriptional regulator
MTSPAAAGTRLRNTRIVEASMSRAASGPASSRAGRPRHRPRAAGEPPAREQILGAAAALFTEHGVAATSTRMIAERVGIRQASLYHHFAGKDEILGELLSTSVRPSLDVIGRLETLVAAGADAAAALYALAVVDVHTLAGTAHNIGALYLLPEVQDARFGAFHAERAALRAGYGRLGAAAASAPVAAALPPDRLGELLIQLVEVVIQIRHAREPAPADTAAVAASCLRLCGLPEPAVTAAAAAADALLASLR